MSQLDEALLHLIARQEHEIIDLRAQIALRDRNPDAIDDEVTQAFDTSPALREVRR